MSTLRERHDHVHRWMKGETGDIPNETLGDVLKDALDLLDEMATCIDQLRAALWDAHYGEGLAVPYVQSRDLEARAVLAKHEDKS